MWKTAFSTQTCIHNIVNMIAIHVHNTEITSLRETCGLFARLLPCGPDLHRTLTHFQEKEDPCLWSDFASFCSNYIPQKIFIQNFRHDFYPIVNKYDPCFGIFLRGSKWDPCLQMFCAKASHLGGTSSYILLCEVLPQFSYSSCRGAQIIPISSIYEMHHSKNFAT